ncbi:S9 family peptidase [Solimonas flava]|uniref:S9 family peptidase n=1 Tax=Solimonas flava TaxID=415849 RepID=UPI0003FE611B|nr:S9 family peptidase [Solimonas flava]
MTASAPLLPRSLLLGNPSRAAPLLSPDGRRISFIAPLDGVLNIWIAPADDPAAARPLTRDTGRGIRQHGWAHAGTHLWYLQDEGGNENFHLYSVPIDGGAALDLTPYPRVQARIVGFSRRFPREALVAVNHRDPRWHDVLRIDLGDGRTTTVCENHGFAQFLADDALQLRVALRNTADGGRDVLVPDGAGWRELFHIGRDDVITSSPLAVGPDDSGLLYFLDSRGRDTAAAVAIDAASGAVTALGAHPRTDVLGVVFNPQTRRPEAYRTDELQPEWTVIDPAVEADFRHLRAQASGDFRIVDRSADDRRWIVVFSCDRLPGHYYLYERDSGRLAFLFSARPDLEGWTLAAMRAVAIEARDGRRLVSYLSLPPDASPAAGPLPMVLLVHGGPWSRDHYGYNPEHQFFASRGYAVLSVNFRGSTGFGKDFVNAGDLEWGGRMHEDLLDAVEWAVTQGIAQRERIAIMGGSYGGYAALAGLSFTPEVFACGIDIVGPSNLETLLSSFPAYWAPLFENFAQRVGDPRTEAGRALLRARSPLHCCERIVRPLLIAQGANDVRVTRAESDQIVETLQRNGQPVIYALYPDEGHGFARPQNRLSFMAIAEAFLASVLGGRCQPYGDDLGASSLVILAGAEQVAAINASGCSG